ncbi:hypothetical protein NA63_2862 [Flavobacteriaceae bacterium MAR_2010_105]|nr:hypothetical protein NA63_2862 [Flavobacteriaceae bacterium MAR_2010_105]
MIKFFRKIRQNMIKENRATKYALYAIGEIILVVIGILIALQINNWNQHRITKNTERDTLKNLLEEIQLDTLDIGFNLQLHKTSLENAERLFKFLGGDSSVQSDSVNFTEVLGNPVVAILNTSTYTSLVNSSPNLISNQILKKKIFVHYNLVYTSILEVENRSTGFKPYDKLLPFFQKHFSVDKEFKSLSLSSNNSTDYFNEDYKRTSLFPRNIELLKSDDEFKVTLSEVIYLRSITISVYQEALKRIKELSNEINMELNNNF